MRRPEGPWLTLVDVGSGKGKQLVEPSRRLGCHVIGLDPLDENLELAARPAMK